MNVFITGAKGYDNKKVIEKILKDVSQVIAGPTMGAEEIAVELAEKAGIKVNYQYYCVSSYISRHDQILNCIKKNGGKVICIEPGADERDKLHVIEECKLKGIPYELLN